MNNLMTEKPWGEQLILNKLLRYLTPSFDLHQFLGLVTWNTFLGFNFALLLVLDMIFFLTCLIGHIC